MSATEESPIERAQRLQRGKKSQINVRVPAYLRRGLDAIVDEENSRSLDDGERPGMDITGLVHKALWAYIEFARAEGTLTAEAAERYDEEFDAYYGRTREA